MIRYLATRAAHERNPYPPNTERWASWNTGFIESVALKWPGKWTASLFAVQTAMVVAASLAWFWLCVAFFDWLRP